MAKVKKKTLHKLRKEVLDAQECFDKLFLYGDHIVIVLPYTLKKIDDKKSALKQYIQTSFEKVLNVDLFTQYLVIWHDFELLSQEHINPNQQF